MIVFPSAVLKRLVDHAERDYPRESCGLIVGCGDAGQGWTVSRIESSPNQAVDPAHRFEIDPRLRLTLQRSLRGGPEAVIGLYHSHPDGAAQPSKADLDMAWEPELAWIIVSVIDSQATQVTAHVLSANNTRFREIALRTEQWCEDAERPPLTGPGLGALDRPESTC